MRYTDLSPVRKPKNCNLSETTIHAVSHYADEHGLSFSRAIEGLALFALPEHRMTGMMALLSSVIRQQIQSQYNRFAKLLVHTAIEAGAAKEAAQHIYFLQLIREMDEMGEALGEEDEITLDSFAESLKTDPSTVDGAAVMNLYKQRRGRFRYRSVEALRRPIAEFTDLLEEIEQWAEAVEQKRRKRKNRKPTA